MLEVPDPADADAEFVERLREGDPSAAEEFVARFGARVRLLVGARVRDREAAREVCNDALYAALTALRKGQLREASRLAAFVAGICRNLANNHIRSEMTRPQELPLSPEVAVLDANLEMEARDRFALAEREISRLEPLDRRILTEMLVDGRGAVEIAGRLGVSAEVVRSRKSRALRRIAALMRFRSRNARGTPPSHWSRREP